MMPCGVVGSACLYFVFLVSCLENHTVKARTKHVSGYNTSSIGCFRYLTKVSNVNEWFGRAWKSKNDLKQWFMPIG